MIKDEFHPSYADTSMHACITCKCGRKVWYGCGTRHTHRPMYCKDCTVDELRKLRRVKATQVGHFTDAQIIETYLSRKFI